MAEDNPEEVPTVVDYYAVLNLNRGASQTEINERHRALSLLFHPDKHRDPGAVEVATEEFLKVQKAYQVLSDPFLREVYDVLGERGLSIKWAPELSTKSREELREELKELRSNGLTEEDFEAELPLKNSCTVALNGICLFHGLSSNPKIAVRGTDGGPLSLVDRLTGFRIYHEELTHTISKRINNKTSVSFGTSVNLQGRRHGHAQYIGTVRYQFSPRFAGKAAIVHGHDTITSLFGHYKDNANSISFGFEAAPTALHILPRTEITYGRQLYPNKPQEAEISLKLHQEPSLSFNYAWPPSLTQDLIDATENGLPSTSGFKHIAFDRSLGIEFSGILPKLVFNIGVSIVELATRINSGFRWGFDGFTAVLEAEWSPKDGRELHVSTSLHSTGVLLRIQFTLWKQRFVLPILLAVEYNPVAAACSVVIPSTLAVLGYCFIIRPRRRAHRISQIRAARQVLEEDSDARRKRNTVIDLLKDSARKVMSSEIAKGGLVIQDAFYGVIDTQEGAHDLTIDVTVAVQALVRNSQLHIASEGSKANLQGFSDPAPFTAKCLRIHYLFRGRPHFVEIPDYLPVVLPLAEHEIGKC